MKTIFSISVVVLFVSSIFVAQANSQVTEPKVINGGVVNGKATSLPKPKYPESARTSGVSGAVTVNIIIDESGNVVFAEAEINSPKRIKADDDSELQTPVDPELRGAAEDAARQARFSPTLLSGQAVQVKGQIIYNFVAGTDKDQTPKSVSGGMVNGRALSLPAPVFPPAAKAIGADGTVSVQVLIDENGDVIEAKAVAGHPLLRMASETAARDAKFAPTYLQGNAVKVSGIVTYTFVGPK